MIAVISDIHGNYPALTEIVTYLEQHQINKIICLGDICGYYPWVNECIEMVRSLTENVLIGNHDYYIINNEPCPRSNSANACLDYQRKVINRENLSWLASKNAKGCFWDINCVHGGWENPIDEYIDTAKLPVWEFDEKFAVSGHTHIPGIARSGNILYCNPGSVGQPRDGNPKASFAIFDGEKFEIIRVAYDWKLVQKKMLECGFNEYYTKNLEFGYRIGFSVSK